MKMYILSYCTTIYDNKEKQSNAFAVVTLLSYSK